MSRSAKRCALAYGSEEMICFVRFHGHEWPFFHRSPVKRTLGDNGIRWRGASGKWQRVWIEFELASRNFLEHQHDPSKCDIIVCWVHNWPECPEEIEVIELGKIIG